MASPIKGTNQNNPSINGTNAADKLQGKDGNDFLKGGGGNDDIDGGKGFDTAVFSGSYFQYLIASLGTGNDKTTVEDTVAGRDGTDLVKKVEALQFSDFTVNLTQNNAAFTRADSTTTSEDSTVNINVLANDADFEGDALTITQIDGQAISVGGSVVLTSGATVTLYANQTLTYDPGAAFQSLNGGEQDLDSFTYTVTDSQGASSAPTAVDVTVNGAWETPTFTANGTVDEAGQKPLTTDLWVGSGIPATGFGLARADDAGIELGLQVIYRQGPTVTTTDVYTDGVLSYQVNDGAQSTANGSSANNAARAAWSFEYSIVTGLNGETTDLGDFTFRLFVDKDPTAAIDYNELLMRVEPLAPGTADTVWQLIGPNTDVIGDDAGNPALPGTVAQNSQNISFGFYGLGAYATAGFPAGQFDIALQAFDALNTLIVENHIQVNVI
jgi:hypothetical protein